MDHKTVEKLEEKIDDMLRNPKLTDSEIDDLMNALEDHAKKVSLKKT